MRDGELEFLEMDRAQKIRQVVNQYGEEKFYISFSGGRDSTVLSEFIDIALPGNNIPRVFANTGIEYAAVVKFVKALAEKDDRYILLKPETPIKQTLERVGYPFKSKEHSKKLYLYQKYGYESKAVQHYLEDSGSKFHCPKILQYQFTPEFDLKISHFCCDEMKKKPMVRYAKETGRKITITGILSAEGGQRGNRSEQACLIFEKGVLKYFHPFKPCSDEFIDYLIDKYSIQLCELYYPPYNFVRTGCKGCPFTLKLQEQLDTMREHLPNEAAQCERIWQPIYSEYRRLGYRLKDEGQMKLNGF